MAFIRAKPYESKKRGRIMHYYLVENYREGKKVRQRVIAYLGDHPTLAGAIAQMEAWLSHKAPGAERARLERRLAALRRARG